MRDFIISRGGFVCRALSLETRVGILINLDWLKIIELTRCAPALGELIRKIIPNLVRRLNDHIIF